MKATWSVPPVLEGHLRLLGRPIAKPVDGFMLVDTGASRTCMALDVAQELQLTAVGLGETFGAGGLHRNEIFEAFLTLRIVDSFGQQTVVNHQGLVMGIPDLGQQLSALGLQAPDGYTTRLIGLLGRDILRYATVTYQGSKGIVEIAFDLDALPRKTSEST